jgi:hypothetical protein
VFSSEAAEKLDDSGTRTCAPGEEEGLGVEGSLITKFDNSVPCHGKTLALVAD